jgi:hypothetical protein
MSPSKISGALYHKVSISRESYSMGMCKNLESPKSASFILFYFILINTFAGFKSL